MVPDNGAKHCFQDYALKLGDCSIAPPAGHVYWYAAVTWMEQKRQKQTKTTDNLTDILYTWKYDLIGNLLAGFHNC